MIVLNNKPSWGDIIGQGVGEGLQLLSDAKMKQMNQQNRLKGLQSLGFSQEEATALSPLSDQLLQPIIKQKMQAPANALFDQERNRLLGQMGSSGFDQGGNIPAYSPSQPMANVPDQSGQQMQQPMGQDQQITPSWAGLNPQQQRDLTNLQVDLEKQKRKDFTEDRKYYTERHKKDIEKIKDEFDKSKVNAASAKDALDLLRSGKFNVGPIEGWLEEKASNIVEKPEVAKYRMLLQDYVKRTYEDSTGRQTKAFQKLVEDSKTKFTDPRKAQEWFWNRVINDSWKKNIAQYAHEDVEEKYGIGKQYKEKYNKLHNIYKNMPTDFPAPKEVTPDTQYEDEKTGIIWGIKNGRWAPEAKAI